VGFWSPYEAAAWTIIGHRIRITQAATLKARIAERLGDPVSFGGRVVHAFPSPQRLAKLDTFPGLAGRKPEWLRSLARAALDGCLDAARLRAMPTGEALADLKKLPGIGDFSAGLTLLPGPATAEQVQQISENWRPYRTWVTLLLRTQLEDETGEITGRHGHARTG
jgi:DNA-3-methyladenine glycosylase II